jgi:hypothetical protein
MLLHFLTLAPPSGIQANVECPVALTPILTLTPVNVGELPRTLDRQNGPFQACSCTSLNVPERTAAGSKTAGCRFDSCPTCPWTLNSSGFQAPWLQHNVCALTPIRSPFDTTRSNTADI